MRYPHTVTFQEPAEDQLPSGQVVRAYADVDGLTDVPARIVPVQQDEQAERMVVERDRFTIIVQGDRAVDRAHRVASAFLDAVLDVVDVQRPVLYRGPRTYATIVTAQAVTAGDEPVS